ncbi:MAG: pantetheine-phosphate adenylyltransferase [Candidatus Cloacimonetes bacterium]|nr:pantetheine-phosphate adenylyltransferase [Candidatus Cloacimonadota bacterium]
MTTVIYPGTFDPVTLGHLNILEKACLMFDSVIMAVADQTGKQTAFTLEERYQLCKTATENMPKVQVTMFQGLFVDYARSQNCRIMVRGMRAVSDFEYELSLALTNKKLNPDVETVFLVPSLRYMYLSSSMIRQLAALGGPLEDFVPSCVAKALKRKFFVVNA